MNPKIHHLNVIWFHNIYILLQVYQAVMAWVKYNIAERRQHLALALQHVRMPLLSPKFLVGTVGADLLIKVRAAINFHFT